MFKELKISELEKVEDTEARKVEPKGASGAEEISNLLKKVENNGL